MDIDPQTLKQTAPGLLGAIGAIFFLRGPWYMRVGLIVPGGGLSYYAAEDVARLAGGISTGLSGFAVGILGMIVMDRIVNALYRFDALSLVPDRFRKADKSD